MATIKGRVIDYDNDAGIQNVTVEGISQVGTVFSTGKTNDNGEFNLNDVGFDSLYSKVRFSAPGYATQTMRPASANNVDVVLPKSNTLAAVTITLKQNKTKILLFAAAGALLAYLFIKYRSQIKM